MACLLTCLPTLRPIRRHFLDLGPLGSGEFAAAPAMLPGLRLNLWAGGHDGWPVPAGLQ